LIDWRKSVHQKGCNVPSLRIMKDRHLFAGLVRLHILHHASHKDVFGVWLMEELGHHGYKLSAGTLYPILHSLERSGYLTSQTNTVDGRQRRLYSATQRGREALELGKGRVRELYRELLEDS
jgi:DNA-binding PadR family transcriptional regulator